MPFETVHAFRRDDDENGHYRFEIGENLAPRFKIMRKFGEGTFGQVWPPVHLHLCLFVVLF